MQQAIVTTFHGPSERRGSRIIARTGKISIVHAIDHSFSVYKNHDLACKKMLKKLGMPENTSIASADLLAGKSRVHIVSEALK